MNSLYLGFEDGNLLLNGADDSVQTTRAITILGYQLSFSDLVFSDMGAMVLLQLAALPTAPTYGPAPSFYLNVPPNPDFTANTQENPNASELGGGIGGTGVFAAFILKSGNGESANQAVALMGLSIPVPAGGYIVAHMDGGGAANKVTDGEIQGVIFYQ
jgi:hypothetical protein